jgi:hypothetical protein
MNITTASSIRVHGGEYTKIHHISELLGCPMNITIYLPSKKHRNPPVLIFLSGYYQNL